MCDRIFVPRVNDSHWDFQSLFRCYQQVSAVSGTVILDLSRCDFLRQNAVAFLGGMLSLFRQSGKFIQIDWATVSGAVMMNLRQNGFCRHCGYSADSWSGNSIPFRHDQLLEPTGLMWYLKRDWLGHGWVGISDNLRDAIAGTVWEIYTNAFEHSASPIGVFSCGQHFPQLRQLKLSVVDFGKGVPFKVRDFFQSPAINASVAIQWAFQPGTTTSPASTRGNGLDVLKSFIRANNGKLEVYSGDGYAIITRDGETFHSCAPYETAFEGTMYNITFICDDTQYCLASELQQPSFV